MNKKIITWSFLIISLVYSLTHFNYHNHIHQTSITSEQKQEEALFSEGAFYYSFYKDIISNQSSFDAIKHYFNNNTYEAPNFINPHSRFNISFELIAGLTFRATHKIIGWSPLQYYNFLAYLLNGLSLFFALLIVYELSKNLWISLLPIALFLTNFEHLTRMLTNTPLRENIGIAVLLAHLFFTIKLLKTATFSDKFSDEFEIKSFFTPIHLGFIASLFLQLSVWQFTQFSLIVNIIAFALLHFFSQINIYKTIDYFILIVFSWFVSVIFLMGNPLVLNSLFFFISISFILTLSIYCSKFKKIDTMFQKTILLIGPFVVGIISHSLFSRILGQGSDNHVFKFISQRFKNTNDFHAKLYLCDDAFNKVGQGQISSLFSTGYLYFLIATFFFSVIFLSKYFFKGNNKNISYYYVLLLTIGFSIIAYMSQRFAIISIPVSIVAISGFIALACDYLRQSLKIKKINIYVFFILSILLILVNKNELKDLINKQRPVSDNTMSELSDYISANSNTNDIFAASMPLTSSIRLLTGRSIFLHPQYENANLRSRVKESYKIYGNFKEENLHKYFLQNEVNYVVIEGAYCFFKSTTGCVMQKLINEGQYESDQQFCAKNFSDSKYFNKVFDNRRFQVLKVLP